MHRSVTMSVSRHYLSHKHDPELQILDWYGDRTPLGGGVRLENRRYSVVERPPVTYRGRLSRLHRRRYAFVADFAHL
jgi:hypothetical protein